MFEEKTWDKVSYYAWDDQRRKGRELCYDFNNVNPKDEKKQREVLEKLIGHIGKGSQIWPSFQCEWGANIYIGDHVFINHNVVILDVDKVTIGDACRIAPNVVISTVYHPNNPKDREDGIFHAREIKIERNVWIGASATILPGVTIGENSIVAAGAVVNRDVPPNVIVAGVPAKIIKTVE